MVRPVVSPKWDSLILSAIVSAFEAYGSALVGITPSEPLMHGAERSAVPSSQVAQIG